MASRSAEPGLRRNVSVLDQVLIGTFVKTPSIHVVELLADTGFDFIVLDQEHAPFQRETIDRALFAARATDLTAVVRVPSNDATFHYLKM